MDYEASLCSGCGHQRSESMDPANDGAYEAVVGTCYACAASDAESRQVSTARHGGQYGKSAFDGLKIGVVMREAANG